MYISYKYLQSCRYRKESKGGKNNSCMAFALKCCSKNESFSNFPCNDTGKAKVRGGAARGSLQSPLGNLPF